MVEVAGAAMILRPRATGPTPRALPRTRCPRRRGRGAAQKSKRQSVNRMRHRRRARPRRSARATDHSTATIDSTGVGANASYPCGRFAAIDSRTGARRSSAEAAESSRRFDHQARHRAGLSCGSLGQIGSRSSGFWSARPRHRTRRPRSRILRQATARRGFVGTAVGPVKFPLTSRKSRPHENEAHVWTRPQMYRRR